MKEHISNVFVYNINCIKQCQHKLATEKKAKVKERYLLTKLSTMALRSSFETFLRDFLTSVLSEGTEAENNLPCHFIIDLCPLLDVSMYTVMHPDRIYY